MESALYPIQNKYRFNTLMNGTWQFETDPNSVGLDERWNMGEFEKQDGIAFLILYFSHRDEIYYMRYEEMLKFWNRGQNGGRKHFKHEELNPKWFLTRNGNYLVPFLEGIALDLKER